MVKENHVNLYDVDDWGYNNDDNEDHHDDDEVEKKKDGGGGWGIIFLYRSLHVKEKNNWNWINVPLTSAVFSSKSRASASIDVQDWSKELESSLSLGLASNGHPSGGVLFSIPK